ncbi:MAG: glycosyltransferase family 4 protein [Candidatus Moranbacteria bacterium]|jgi:glycosyltransferase involved in cell wall biosynthesis|nr:glycosyltransferase family 4 protein [Candidatus Moranbacteria bacterium]
MEMRNILVVSTFFAPHVGGVEVYTERLFSRLASRYREARITLLVLNTDDAPEYERVSGIDVYRMPCFRFPSVNPFFSPFELVKMIRKIDIDSFDIVITQCRYYFLTNALGAIARYRKIPLIHIEHNAGFMKHGNPFIQVAAWSYDRLLGPLVLRRSRVIICVSEGVRKFLLKAFHMDAHRLLVRESGIDTDGWNQVEHVPHEDYFPVLAYVGRLIESKGILLLLESVRNLKAKYPRIHLFVAGSGQDEDRVKCAISEYGLDRQVSLLGNINHDAMRNLYRSVDILINPSYYPEGLQITLLEAACSGLAIVTTDVSGANELFRDGDSALIVEKNNMSALERGIVRLLEDSELRRRLGERARQEVSEVFSWEKKADAFYEAIWR